MGEVGPVGKQWNCGIDCWVTVGGERGFWEIAMNSGREGIMGENGELWACTEYCGRVENCGIYFRIVGDE